MKYLLLVLFAVTPLFSANLCERAQAIRHKPVVVSRLGIRNVNGILYIKNRVCRDQDEAFLILAEAKLIEIEADWAAKEQTEIDKKAAFIAAKAQLMATDCSSLSRPNRVICTLLQNMVD